MLETVLCIGTSVIATSKLVGTTTCAALWGLRWAALALALHTKLPRTTGISTRSTMGGIPLRKDTSPRTKSLPCTASALPIDAQLPRTTGVSTRSTMRCVRFDVDALSSTNALPCGTIGLAFSCHTLLTRTTGFVTNAAMLGVDLQIDAACSTGRLPRRAQASGVLAALRGLACHTALSAVAVICFRIHTSAVADDLSAWALELTQPCLAGETVGTTAMTASTMESVCLDVGA